MCTKCAEHNRGGYGGTGSVGYRGIPVGAVYFPADIPTSSSISLAEAERRIFSGEVQEGDILFAVLMDIIASDGEVG